MRSELLEKLTHHALLHIRGGRVDDIEFLHHTWRDFLIARWIRDALNDPAQSESVARLIGSRPLPECVAEFLASFLEAQALRTACQNVPRFRDPVVFPKILSVLLRHCELVSATDRDQRTELFFSILGSYRFSGKLLPSVRFVGLKLAQQTFAGCDLRDSQFVECDLSGASFERAILTNASFDGCDLRACVFTRAAVHGARFDDSDLERADFAGSEGLSDDQARSFAERGALVGAGSPPTRKKTNREVVHQLVRKTLEKFRDSASVLESALDRGIPPSQREFVRKRIVPALMRAEYIEGIFRGKKHIIKRLERRNPSAWRLVDENVEDEIITPIIEDLVRQYK